MLLNLINIFERFQTNFVVSQIENVLKIQVKSVTFFRVSSCMLFSAPPTFIVTYAVRFIEGDRCKNQRKLSLSSVR